MIQFRSVFFEDVYGYIDKERQESGLFRIKQQKLVLISGIKKYLMHGFFLFFLKNLALNSELRFLIF
jgi:hypothetical protein